jgi:cobalamin synthase
MRIALSVIWAALTVGGGLALGGKVLGSPDIQLAAVVFLFGVANLVTGFYFGRTNHQRSGGVGGDTAGTR